MSERLQCGKCGALGHHGADCTTYQCADPATSQPDEPRATEPHSPLEKAIVLSAGSHLGQRDKQGEPYILHPLRVMSSVAEHGEAAMIAAVLHDVVEDCDVELFEVRVEFGAEIGDAVDSLSRRDLESYAEFISRCAGNPLGRLVKIADINDNLSRIDGLAEAERIRLGKRYRSALESLNAKAAP